MHVFKQVANMTEDEKKAFVNTTGVIMLCVVEGKCSYQMAKELKLEPYEVEHNIDEMLYDLRKGLGLKRYLKALFIK